VQEFPDDSQHYNAEYGRATGGVINIVTKSGGNDFHGDVFGYFRNKAFQARTPSPVKLTPTATSSRQAGLYPHAIWVDLRRRPQEGQDVLFLQL